MMYDVITVGLGPGGSTAARLLANAGYHVLGLDKERFPRYKPCGGGLSARVLPHLPDSVRPCIETTIHRIRFTFRGTRVINHPSTQPVAYMVRRPQFDQSLANEAATAGAEIRYGEEVRSVRENDDCVEVETGSGAHYRTRFLIGSDGAHSRIGRLIDPRPAVRPSWSLEAETPRPAVGSTSTDEIWLDLGTVPGGYGWSFPKRDHLSIGVAGFGPTPANPKSTLSAYVHAQQPVKPDTALTLHSHPIPAVSDPWRRLASHRLAVIGDAAHLVDPFFGEGIYYAIRSGEIAAEAITAALRDHTKGLISYHKWATQLFEPEFRLATKLASVAYRLPFLWYLAMRAWPDMTQEFYMVLRGERTYQQIIGKMRTDGSRFLAVGLRRRVQQLLS